MLGSYSSSLQPHVLRLSRHEGRAAQVVSVHINGKHHEHQMVRLLGIASSLLLLHISLVTAGSIPLLPGGGLISRAGCETESYDIPRPILRTHLMYSPCGT